VDRRERVRQYLEAAGGTDIRPTSEGWMCRCFYHEAGHRSKGRTLSVHVDKGLFLCHSAACGRGGFFTTILVERCGLSFRQAREVAEGLRVADLPDPSSLVLPAWDARRAAQPPTVLNPAVLGVYDRCPRYMLERGFSKATLRSWDIGYDKDARRVTFPVFDREGRLVGVTKRAVEPDVQPRYLHVNYQKGLVLYGEHRAEAYASRLPLILVEGPTSVLRASQHGVPNVVATLGATVTLAQVRRAARYRRVVLAFDGDAAGRAATHRAGYALARRLEVGALEVADQYSEGAKDPDEEPDPASFFARTVPWEVWAAVNAPPARMRFLE
jgi:hypothetical protein